MWGLIINPYKDPGSLLSNQYNGKQQVFFVAHRCSLGFDLLGDFLRILLMVNHHYFTTIFGRICFGTFSKHRRVANPSASPENDDSSFRGVKDDSCCLAKWFTPRSENMKGFPS